MSTPGRETREASSHEGNEREGLMLHQKMGKGRCTRNGTEMVWATDYQSWLREGQRSHLIFICYL